MSLVSRHPTSSRAWAPRRDDVALGQRARLLAAMARGRRRARLSGDHGRRRRPRGRGLARTFYEQFASKEACFLEAYRHGIDVLDAEVARAVAEAPAGDWRAQLRAGIRAYLATLAAEPAFARTYLLEIHAAGEAALAERSAGMRRFAARYRATAAAPPAPASRTPRPLFVLCAGTEQLCAERLRDAGRPR